MSKKEDTDNKGFGEIQNGHELVASKEKKSIEIIEHPSIMKRYNCLH